MFPPSFDATLGDVAIPSVGAGSTKAFSRLVEMTLSTPKGKGMDLGAAEEKGRSAPSPL